MNRFYISKEAVRGNRITISGKEAHHILDVMRLKTLDKVITFDGTGKEYIGFIKDVRRKSLTVEVIQMRDSSLGKEGPKITLIQAVPKKEKMDYIVEKATELGVYAILPILTKRTVVNWTEPKKHSASERWRRIAKEASKQCGRADIPTIGEIRDFKEVITDSSDYDFNLIAALSEEATCLKEALRSFRSGHIAVAIGPEGDFTPEEIKRSKAARFILVSLGSRVLKSDTAGLTLLAVLNYEFSG